MPEHLDSVPEEGQDGLHEDPDAYWTDEMIEAELRKQEALAAESEPLEDPDAYWTEERVEAAAAEAPYVRDALLDRRAEERAAEARAEAGLPAA